MCQLLGKHLNPQRSNFLTETACQRERLRGSWLLAAFWSRSWACYCDVLALLQPAEETEPEHLKHPQELREK